MTHFMETELRFKQIQCVPVPNTPQTQCNVLMYGLTEAGEVWFKRGNDGQWFKESMATNDKPGVS